MQFLLDIHYFGYSKLSIQNNGRITIGIGIDTYEKNTRKRISGKKLIKVMSIIIIITEPVVNVNFKSLR